MTETTTKAEKYPELQEAHEHFKAARKAMRQSFEAWLPAGYLENRRAARKEILLGIRKLVDVAIDRLDEKTR